MEGRANVRVVVIGPAPEVETTQIPGITITRTTPHGTFDSSPPSGRGSRAGQVAATIIDLREVDFAAIPNVARLRARAIEAPALVIATGSIDEEVLESLGATDTLILPTSAKTVARRIRNIVTLGRARLEARVEIDTLSRRLGDELMFGHAILDGVEVGIVTADDEGVITFVNRSAATLLEIGRDVNGADAAAVLGLTVSPAEILDGELRKTLTYELETTTGTILDLHLSVARGERAHDGHTGYFFIFHDATEEKSREEERRRFERLVAMGTMVAGFAHEVRNPVAALRSIAEELAEEHTERGIALPHVGRMLTVLERIERLVRTSLQFGRPAAPRRARHDAWTILASAIEGIGPRLRASGEKLKVEIDPKLPDVVCDESQITQAMVVLLDNALDAAGSPRRVTLRAGRGRPSEETIPPRKSQPPPNTLGWVRFEVSDQGPGVPPDILGRIFDPFFTTKAQGTGLGLSIAQQVVSENGGRLEVTSPRGGPTTFSILLPTHPA